MKIKKGKDFSLENHKIELIKGDYVKFLGITSKERTPLFSSDNNYAHLLKLSNNLDLITTSILSGEVDKVFFVSEQKKQKKTQKFLFSIKNNIIYIVYGVFPDITGKWILEQMSNYYSGLVRGKDVNNLKTLEQGNIELEFRGRVNDISSQYRELKDLISEQDTSYLGETLRIDYVGLSCKSIGVISLLLGESQLNIEMTGTFSSTVPVEELDIKETILSTKIELLFVSIRVNTGAIPRGIIVKLGFQNYRFITFKEYRNNYLLTIVSEGNLEKLNKVEKKLDPFFKDLTQRIFNGDLGPFNSAKKRLRDFLSKNREFS